MFDWELNSQVIHMTRKEFEKLVEDGYEKLPEGVRDKIKNVAILIEDEPSAADRAEQRLSDDETLLGLYKGIPLTARGDLYGVGMTLPDTITLYQFPIEDAAREECSTYEVEHGEYAATVKKIVAETIWHEFAHHFGMDEQEVRLREQERDARA